MMMHADTATPFHPEFFAGRAAALDRLDALLAGAMAGRGSAAFVAGEPGAGKTTLLQEFCRRSQQHHEDLVVAFGDCNPQTGAGDAYLPFREILALLTGDVEDSLAEQIITRENASRLRSFMRTSAEAVVESGPDLVGIFIPGGSLLFNLGRKFAERSGMVARRAGATAAARADRAAPTQSSLLQQYTSVLRLLATKRPLVLVIDDLHWADTASLDLFFHLARRIEGSRLLLLGSYRPTDVAMGRGGERHPLDPVVHEITRHYGNAVLDLGEYERDEAREFVDLLLDSEPNRLDNAFRVDLIGCTHGNPLFTVELLRSLRESGAIARDGTGAWSVVSPLSCARLPSRVEGVIAERLARLDERARLIITTAAVDGDEFTAEVVAGACGLPEREVVRVLGSELERRHAIVAAQGSRRVGGRRASLYRFRHNLFQRHLYESLDPVQKAYLHQDLADALEAFHGDDRDPAALRLARHHRAAGNALEAARYFHAAGLDAARRVAAADAAEQQAAALAQLDEAAPSPESQALRLDVLYALAEGLVTMGRHEDAAAHVGEALRLAPTAPPLVRARLYRLLGASASTRQEGPASLALLDRAEAELGVVGEQSSPDTWYEWLQVQEYRAWALYHQRGAVATLEALLRRIEAPLARYGSAAQQRTFGGCRILLRLRTERYRVSAETVALARQNVAAAEATGSVRERVFAGFELGFCQLWAGAIDDAAGLLAEALDAARRIGDAAVITLSLTYLAFISRLRRDVTRTERLAEELLSQAESSSMRSYAAVARGHLAWCRMREGDTAAAIDQAREAVRMWEEELSVAYPLQWAARLPLLEALAATGDAAGAAAQVRALLDQAQQPLAAPAAAALNEALAALDAGDDVAACDAFVRGASLAEAGAAGAGWAGAGADQPDVL
jgi:hypothetical protein